MAHILSVAVLLTSAGLIDEEATLASCAAQLAEHKVEAELEDETISAAVEAVFDKYPIANIAMPALVNDALRSLNVEPSNYKAMEAKVSSFIRRNSDQTEKKDKKTGEVLSAAEPKRTRRFGIKKGVGGGVCRWSTTDDKE